MDPQNPIPTTNFSLACENTENAGKPEDSEPSVANNRVVTNREPLTTKEALKLLLAGTLKAVVCRYCLNTGSPLSELDQILHITGRGAFYDVTIRDMVATFHPFKVVDDPNLPNKVCNKCLNQVIRSYLFAQQCEQSERAIRNYYDDMFEKLMKLDPLEPVKKRGKPKLHPNHNILYTEHRTVIEYAEPIINLINSGAESFTHEPEMSEFECKKCWQVLPNIESLVNHEKIHPKTMWYNCRLCGKSYQRIRSFKSHLKSHKDSVPLPVVEKFVCKQCNHATDNYFQHLQHIENHKFKRVFQHLVDNNMDNLCAVCLDSGKLVNLDKTLCIHGGYPELTGDRTLYNILGSTIPEMNIVHNYTGTKICETCLDKAITSYIFINRTHYIRNRLDTCITQMLVKLKEIKLENKLFIEIAQNAIVPVIEDDDLEDLLITEMDDADETKLKVDVLEEEFRLKSESENSESDDNVDENNITIRNSSTVTETAVVKTKLLNGYQTFDACKLEDVCSEFLTFKKKKLKPEKVHKCRYACPICDKHFISDYFFKKHLLKHIAKRVNCKICCAYFKSKFDLLEHMKITHLLKCSQYSSCETCGRVFANENKMIQHEAVHRNKQCELCLKIFKSQRHYDTHIRRHVLKQRSLKRNNVQNCSFCEKECSNDNELSIHVNKIHLKIKPYSCDMCDRHFYTELTLNSHKKIHSLFRKEVCEFCSKTLRCRKDLVVHVRKHIGIEPFKCAICPRAFYSDVKLRSHMKMWHGGCYCCKMCRKVFVNKKGLRNHVIGAHSVF